MAPTGAPPAAAQLRIVGTLAVIRAGLTVTGAGLGSRKARTLLGLLAVERRHVVTQDRVVEVLWPEQPPFAPADNIATLVSRLRRDLGAELIVGGRSGYRLAGPPTLHVDLDRAEEWTAEAERRQRQAEPALALAAGLRAGELVLAGEVLADETWADWAEPARAEHRALAARLRHVLIDAALAVGDHARAQSVAAAAVAADPYDEAAVRLSMRAHLAAGEAARALAGYQALRRRLADDLGADPAAETQHLHLQILRGEAVGAAPTPATPAPARGAIVGRASELQRLQQAWYDAASGRPVLLLVSGEAGIGKSRLCEELLEVVVATGGTVLSARCYETEQSLFLQPLVDAVRSVVRTLPPDVFRELAGDDADVLAGLLPEAAAVLGIAPLRRRGSAEIERRLAFDAIGRLLSALAQRGPIVVFLDDVHNAGQSTIEFLHHFMRRLSVGRLLVMATVRSIEGAGILEGLAGVAGRLELGPLPAEAVTALASAAGVAEQAEAILQRTRGHTLYVVETLRALAAGSADLPPSLGAAVLARVRKAGRAVEEVLRAAAVLGSAFDPSTLARVREVPVGAVVEACGDALEARLVTVAGREYEFAHDLVREVLYATTPEPTRRAYHVRAADVLADRPEALAGHAAAVEDWPRAARGYLLAGEQALGRAAAGDAVQLFGRSLDCAGTAGTLDDVRSRALLGRGRAYAAMADYAAALVDIEAAVLAAREAGDQRLEILALRQLGGEIPTALGRSVRECLTHLERGLGLATSLSDRLLQADVQAWIAILSANGLRFQESVAHGARAVQSARSSGDVEALAVALDGYKTSLAYLGEVADLEQVVTELDPLLRRLGDLFRLHWTVFESSFPALARGDWAAAADRMRTALRVQRRSGFSAYAGWHVAHLGWVARLQGRYGEAMELGRRSLALCDEATHVWCAATARAHLGVTLLEVGDRAEAVRVLESARAAATQEGAEAYLLRCLAPLAEASGSRTVLEEADALLHGITAPPGAAFLLGDWCYLAVARTWLSRREPDRARAVLEPLLLAAERIPWVGTLAAASLVDGHAAAMLGLRDQAADRLRLAADFGTRYGMPGIAREARLSPVS